MKPPPRTLRLDIDELETAFDGLSTADSAFDLEAYFAFLDLTTGRVLEVESEKEAEDLSMREDMLELPADLFDGRPGRGLEAFVASLPEQPSRGELERAIRGKGAFRRFKNIVRNDVELEHRWHWFEALQKRERMVEWLRDHGIEPDWGGDIFEPPPLPDKRGDLLRAVDEFVREAMRLTGLRRIALLGSLTTSKAIPKDVDLLVEVDDDMPLGELARLKRQLQGKTMQTGDGCGADVFLCNPRGEYLGRICPWKTCEANIRRSCEAQHCGRRQYLHDDLGNLHLQPELIAEPPLELWPEVIVRADLPEDLRQQFAL